MSIWFQLKPTPNALRGATPNAPANDPITELSVAVRLTVPPPVVVTSALLISAIKPSD